MKASCASHSHFLVVSGKRPERPEKSEFYRVRLLSDLVTMSERYKRPEVSEKCESYDIDGTHFQMGQEKASFDMH